MIWIKLEISFRMIYYIICFWKSNFFHNFVGNLEKRTGKILDFPKFSEKMISNLIIWSKTMKKLVTGMIWRLWWNRLHRIVLNLDKSVSIHYRNTKYLLTEIYQVKIGISPPINSDIFSLSENSSYNLRFGVTVNRQNIRTSKVGFETVSVIRAILWNDLPAELKNEDS